MERALTKMARQLAGLDEASLMGLWEKYAALVRQFEPTARWEEAVLIFGFLQSMRFKNQLFNYHWAGRGAANGSGVSAQPVPPASPASPDGWPHELGPESVAPESAATAAEDSGGPAGGGGAKRGKVLRFRPRKDG